MTTRPVAWVTGSGRGIGKAAAVALAGRGFDIVLHERTRADDTDEALQAVTAAGAQARVVHGDVADLAGQPALLAEALQAFGRLDCLIANAGVSVMVRGDLLDVGVESFDRCMAVNTRGLFFLLQHFARHLLASDSLPDRHRSIVVTTSSNAEAISINRSEYCVSKAAASMVTRLFAARLAPHGIGVYEIRPGIIRTPMTAPSTAKYDAFFAQDGAPMPRWGEAEEVGRCIATLASGDLPYTVGQAIAVDGGLTMKRF
ncbi:MAG TPA: 3-ketoacyl-ACP reductase [Geminicoccus sp.]|uniref:3-ketoacyl-ACP reductase n=1 Tax=Geminicoccus sp. TaxID=2024832 RepID=UPI002CEBA16F|nr:3-ketoacyl-ACP reductase [Geminicoccus sp.]HWL67739.1 3-ketoacyl-ACP reductase [Geminicoccus sp.]